MYMNITCVTECGSKYITQVNKLTEGREDNETEKRNGASYEALHGTPSRIKMGDKTSPSKGSLTLIDQLQLARQITLGMVCLIYRCSPLMDFSMW